MTHAICRPPTSRAITARPPRNRARRAIATLALLLPLAASEARAGIGFVKNIGTNASATTDTTIEVTVPAAGVATVNHATSAWTEGTVNGMLHLSVSTSTNATFVVCPSTSPPCATISISACHHRSHQG